MRLNEQTGNRNLSLTTPEYSVGYIYMYMIMDEFRHMQCAFSILIGHGRHRACIVSSQSQCKEKEKRSNRDIHAQVMMLLSFVVSYCCFGLCQCSAENLKLISLGIMMSTICLEILLLLTNLTILYAQNISKCGSGSLKV